MDKDILRTEWEQVDRHSEADLNEYVSTHPDSPFVPEARAALRALATKRALGYGPETLEKEIRRVQNGQDEYALLNPAGKANQITKIVKEYLAKDYITKRELTKMLRAQHNLLNSAQINDLINHEVIEVWELEQMGIDRKFLQKLREKLQPTTLPPAGPINSIKKQSTEIYFWGIPSSGKTCALGAILSVANDGSVAHHLNPDPNSQGYAYLSKLDTIFKEGEVTNLIEGTSMTSFYEMGFDLSEKSTSKVKPTHPITCIDMAGELMRCMQRYNEKEILTDEEYDMMATLKRILTDPKTRSRNRKWHIFVLEYGGEDKIYRGLPQSAYLQGTKTYIEENGIFKGLDTYGVFILVTKIDKMPDPTKEKIKQYVTTKYAGFYNGLTELCRKQEINGGVVEIIPFSLGEVCFQEYCKFNSRAAANVVQLMLDRTATDTKNVSKWQKFLNIFKH